MNKLILLVVILLVAVCLPFFLKINITDGFANNNLERDIENTPGTESDILLKDSYPPTGRTQISDDTANDTWWYYPTFELGSYAQITNNIRYSDNPDLGSCMPVSMCGVLYHDKQQPSNYIKPLPPLNPECGTRVGYFDTDVNLLPYRSNMQNILY
jgi:hypothetical protein